jgi:ADP-ribose pyrophosphatase
LSGDRDYRILSKRRVHPGFLNIDEVDFEFKKFKGGSTGTITHQIMERGDSVAVLAYDRRLGAFVLVKQFRVAVALNERVSDAWLLEIPAGGIDAGETARETARRELREETGYAVCDLHIKSEDVRKLERFKHICTAYVSPGGTTERVHIYYIEVDEAMDRLPGAGGGNPAEGEDIKVVHMSPEDVFRAIDAGEVLDAKLIIAAQWFRNRGQTSAAHSGEHQKTFYRFNSFGIFEKGRGPVIGFKIGDIGNVHGVDVWLNSENTDMVMDRFFGRSISSRVRYLGAEKSGDDRIVGDTIANELRTALGGEFFIKPGDHLVTGPGYLRYAPHKVRRIIHVASVQGAVGRGMVADAIVSRDGVTKALMKVHKLNEGMRASKRYRSILIPLLGAGQGGVKAADIADAIVPAVIDFLTAHQDTALEKIFFAAYSDWDYRVLARALNRYTASELGVRAVLEPFIDENEGAA